MKPIHLDEKNSGFVHSHHHLPAPTLTRARVVTARVERKERKVVLSDSRRAYLLDNIKSPCKFGSVFFARLLRIDPRDSTNFLPVEGTLVVKKSYKRKMREMQSGENPLDEISILQVIGEHPHIISLVEACEDEEAVYVIMHDFGKELFHHVVENRRLSECEARDVFQQQLHAVSFSHRQGFAHRDLSLENVLVRVDPASGRLHCVLIDFGMALCLYRHNQECLVKGNTVNNDTLTTNNVFPRSFSPYHCWMHRGHCLGKAPYMAPEAFQQLSPCHAMLTDIWSMGAMLLAMVTGQLLLSSGPKADDIRYQYIAQGKLAELLQYYGNKLSQPLVELLQSLLNPNPLLRPLIEEIAAHPWVVSG